MGMVELMIEFFDTGERVIKSSPSQPAKTLCAVKCSWSFL